MIAIVIILNNDDLKKLVSEYNLLIIYFKIGFGGKRIGSLFGMLILFYKSPQLPKAYFVGFLIINSKNIESKRYFNSFFLPLK